MFRITIAHTIRHRISSASFFKRRSIEPFDKKYNRRLIRWTGHVTRIPLSRSPRQILKSLVDIPRPRVPKIKMGPNSDKSLQSYDLPTEFVEFARWRLIEINGVLFAVLKCRVQQKLHLPPHDNIKAELRYGTIPS
jgi:hypothetical protein